MPDTDLWRFHGLILHLRDHGEPGFGEEALLPLLHEHPEVVTELATLGRTENHARVMKPNDAEVLWGLYALSRLVDILLAAHQPVNDDPSLESWIDRRPWWHGPLPSTAAWPAFCAAAGATPIAEDRFHPFFHEIVDVEEAPDPDEPPRLVAEMWPGALIGGLLLARAGVKVRAGKHHLDPQIAAKSCLYWAWWRRNRIARDRSHGWGHNSQWRTDFRRDYVVGDGLHYNVDAVGRTGPSFCGEDDLAPEVERDLLRYRHGTTVDLGDDCSAWNASLVETRG